MNLKLSILIIIIAISLKIQAQIEIRGIQLDNSIITKTEEIESKVFEKKSKGSEYEVLSKVRVQISCSGVDGEWDYKEIKYRITTYKDSDCSLLDSINQSIDKYWKEQIKLNDFKNIEIRDGFYKISPELSIPMIKSETEIEGKAYSIFWYNKTLYKIELLKSGGPPGSLISFIEQNLRIKSKLEKYKIEELIRIYKETEKLIKDKKGCT
ncbi:hypothetical protein V8G69_16150 [Gaetbulibacter sp. M235]|uniref:hypothetical protein n=1 Tax=Gaetbulibacter sp. M235 TaxID=3126510 RepID=UPI00374F719D